MPASARTMVIVPTLLDSVERVEELIAHLEVQALGNLDPHIHFALLSDFPDAATETQPQDAEILEAARARHRRAQRQARRRRRRTASSCSTACGSGTRAKACGWGGSASAARSRSSTGCCAAPPTPASPCRSAICRSCRDVKYCITLDSDTRLPRGVARELIGIIAHPLNRATFDPRVGRVTEGYGILQPRISVTFMSAAGSLFARLYAGHTGVDPYTTAVSDTYQDLFAEGIFTGKGLYDVDAFIAALEDSVPENALLSHDLFEGLHARVALVSDVELVDDYPSSVLSHARRQHRWVRGDWQILFWLFPFVPSRRGLQAQHAAAHRPLEDSRQPAPQPGRAGAAGAARRRVDGAAGRGAGSGRAMVVGVAASQLLPRRWRGCSSARAARSRLPVFLAQPAARRVDGAGADRPQPDASSPSTRSTPLHAIVADAGAAGRHQAPAARVGDRRHHRGAGGGPRRAAGPARASRWR